VKNLLSTAVNRGHLRSLNYNETVFGRGSDALPDPRVGWGGDTSSSFSSLLASSDVAVLQNWYPHFLDQSYARVLTFHTLRIMNITK